MDATATSPHDEIVNTLWTPDLWRKGGGEKAIDDYMLSIPSSGGTGFQGDYNKDVIGEYKKSGGRWNADNKVWVFPADKMEVAREIATRYGHEETPVRTPGEQAKRGVVRQLLLNLWSNRGDDERDHAREAKTALAKVESIPAAAWDSVWSDMVPAVAYFLRTGKMLSRAIPLEIANSI